MSKTKKIILAVNLLLVLGFFVYAVSKYEERLANSTEILLQLGPVDPRSLMQGDYMELDYSLRWQIPRYADSTYIVVKVAPDKEATFERLQNDKTLHEGELLLRYTRDSKGKVCIGAETYFFQEGTDYKYSYAQYGLVKVDSDGNCTIVGLCNAEKELIK